MDSKTVAMQAIQSVDGYVAAFPEEVRARLETLRAIIRAAAPEAEERISYQMPAYFLHGRLVYFAAFKRHIGLYATGSAIAVFEQEVAQYRAEKTTLRFPNNQPLPVDLIRKLVEFRVAENLRRADAQAATDDRAPE